MSTGTHPRKVAIVTGGAGAGIGHGITAALIQHGWAVVVVDRDDVVGCEFVWSLRQKGEPVYLLAADITAKAVPEAAVETALQEFGRLDALVNNAGAGLCKPIAEVTDEEFDHLLNLDLRAVVRFCRAALPELQKARGGSIVNIGSVHAHATIAGYGIYAAIKASVEALTRGLAIDYGPLGIRANCIHPGMVASPQNRDLISRFTKDVDAWIARYTTTKQLLPYLPTGQEVGELAAFLMGDAGRSITGQSIVIDGGSLAMLFEREATP
jgi:NAD(P)-dependent dehydrogenase (short-subunit alcohol dehydrogenase family)